MDLKNQLKIVGMRGTIFVPQIQFSWELVKRLQPIFEVEFIPSVNMSPAPMFIEGKLMNTVMSPGEWSLISQDKKQRIMFQSQKIDVIEELNADYSVETISRFGERCKLLFSSMVPDPIKCSRIAIAPTFEYIGEKDSIIKFANTCFHLNEFKGVKMDNCDFSQVFRVQERISDSMDVYFNYLSKFYTINKVVPIEGVNQLVEVSMIDFDINSKIDPDVVFDNGAINDFFSKVDRFCADFISFYFHE